VPGPSPQEESFEEVAVRIQDGDRAAEERFVAIFQGRVRAFARVNLGEPHLVDELVQDVMWAVIRALREGRVQEPKQLGAFVFGTARNLVNDVVRTKAREKLGPLPEAEIARAATEQQEFERGHAARQAIAKLEPHERDVLMLSLVEGLNPEQIGERLGIRADAVRQRKARALRRLGETLGIRSQTSPPRLLKGVDTR
jgi:RNA polymerase sigma factor (sigma-70 family)